MFITLVFLAHPHTPVLHILVAQNHFKPSITLHSHNPNSRTRSLKIKGENILTLWVLKKLTISEAQCLRQRLTEKEGVLAALGRGSMSPKCQGMVTVTTPTSAVQTLLYQPVL